MLNTAYLLTSLYAVVCLNLIFVVGEKPISYPINWSIVPSEKPKLRNLESPYLGKCMCDITWGACDPNCCCDDDCTDVERFKFYKCLREKIGSFPLRFCSEDKEKNKPLELGRQNSLLPKQSGYYATCLVRLNGVTQDITPFFAFPTENLKPGSLQIDDWFKVENSRTFVVDGPISQLQRITTTTDTPQYKYIGYLTTPISRQDGFCMSQGRYVRFMNPIVSTTCLLSGDQICQRFSTALYENIVLTYPEYSSKSEFTPVNLELFNDLTNEALFTVTAEASIPLLYKTAQLGEVCKNAVVKIRTFLEYYSNDEGLLLSFVKMQLYLRDVSLKSVQPVHFQTKFIRAGTLSPLTYVSGTVGYFEGDVVRAGELVHKENKSAIAELVTGFSIPSGGRMCSGRKYRKVSFFHDIRFTGCTVSLSEEELRDACLTDGTGPMLRSILGIGSESSNFVNYVARTNDAQTNDTTSWVKIEGLDFGDIMPKYDEIQGRCSNIYVGLRYNFVVSRVGAETNPQNIITAAFAIPIVGSWRLRSPAVITTAVTFLQKFRFEVSFIRSGTEIDASIQRRVIAPPLLTQLDDNVFYPFKAPI